MTRVALVTALCVIAVVTPAASRQGLAGYIGIKLCNACHRKTSEEIVSAFPRTGHASALWAIGDRDEQHRVLGDFSAKPGFTLKNVAWVVGKGVHVQGYLDPGFNALPQEWAVATKQWQPGQTGDAKKSCLGCHTTGYDVASGQWSDPGVTCEACHGPGANHMKSSDKAAAIVRPQGLPPERQAMICGRCHAQGKNADGLPFAADHVPGEDLAQHFSLEAEAEPGARGSQYNDIVGGKHLKNGITCITCHDPHGASAVKTHQLRKPADELCTECHAATSLTGPQHVVPKDCMRCHMPQGSHRFESPQEVSAETP